MEKPTAEYSSGWQLEERFCYRKTLSSLDDLAGFNAAGTHFQAAVGARVELNANRLKIRIETPAGFVIRVGNVVPELRPFAAYIASHCHK